VKKNKINFTISSIEKIPFPEKGAKTYYDTKENGLSLIVSYGGSKTFYLYKKIDGRPERVKIGRFPDIKVEQARSKTIKFKSQINDGINPNKAKHDIAKESTLGNFFEEYMIRHSEKYNKPRTVKDNRNYFRLYLKSFSKRKLSSIKRNELELYQSKLKKEKGLYAANGAIKLFSRLYNKSIQWGWEGLNPTLGIRKFKEPSRDVFLKPEELTLFFKSLDKEKSELVRDYVYISLLTGQRRANVMAMKWADLYLSKKENESTWRIPETKNGEPLTVPITKEALKILKIRKKHSTSGIWVFPSNLSKSGHLEEPKRIWKRILKRAGLTNIRLHDLRRTMGSYQAMTGSSGLIIGKTLGQKSQKATAIYARMNLDSVRDSMEKSTDKMFENKE